MSQDRKIEHFITPRANMPETVIRGSVFTRHCRRCHSRLVNSPSGDKLLRDRPEIAPICSMCYQLNPSRYNPVDQKAIPDTVIANEIHDVIPNPWKYRN